MWTHPNKKSKECLYQHTSKIHNRRACILLYICTIQSIGHLNIQIVKSPWNSTLIDETAPFNAGKFLTGLVSDGGEQENIRAINVHRLLGVYTVNQSTINDNYN